MHEGFVQFHGQRRSSNNFGRSTSSLKKHIRTALSGRSTCTAMKKLFFILTIFSLSLIGANATEQDTVNRSAETIREFRHMPEKGIPSRILRRARGLAIISVVKAGFIFSGKAGEGVVVARTKRGWSGPSFIGTGGAGWGPQIGAEVTDFVIVLNNEGAVRASSKGGNVT